MREGASKVDRLNRLRESFLLFLVFSVFGWCYEVFLEVVVYHWGFTNRGVLFGPYCPVYGFAGLIFLLIYQLTLRGRFHGRGRIMEVILTYVITALTATLIELLASYILEYFTGHWLWETYVNYKYNFQGRIALSTSLRFGIGGLIFVYGFYPPLHLLYERMKTKHKNILAVIFLGILVCDMIYTFFLK